MTADELLASIGQAAPPGGLADEVRALWHDARGEWAKAHAIVQDLDSADAALVHAYLHRKEGDLANATYWYRRAAAVEAVGTLDDEWRAIAGRLLGEA